MQGITATGTWVAGANSMTVVPTSVSTLVTVGQLIQATGIPVGAKITSTGIGTITWDPLFPATLPGTNAVVAFATPMTVATLYTGITDLLMGRSVPTGKMAEAIRKAVLEFSEGYKFTELQETGPLVQFQVGVSSYMPNYFLNPGSLLLKVNKVNSFFIYTDGFVSLSDPSSFGNNAGNDITFRTIDRMEVLMNTSGLPLHWTRFDANLYFGCCPDQPYYTFMRYQREHPFPNAGTNNAGLDTLYLPDSWQEALEYAAASRLAPAYNLSSKASELNSRLKGDEKFQRSGGIEGTPGLIFGLTSDENRDQSTTVRRFRLRMGRS